MSDMIASYIIINLDDGSENEITNYSVEKMLQQLKNDDTWSSAVIVISANQEGKDE